MAENNSSRGEGSTSNRGGGGINFPEFLAVAMAFAIVFLIFLLVVYSIVLGLSAGAIYLGAMLGSNRQVGKKPRHQRVKDIEAEKQKDLNELQGESEELRELVDSSFEREKMELYREDDRPEPAISVNLDAVKTVAKKVAKKVIEKTR
jgi:hypothetical protein